MSTTNEEAISFGALLRRHRIAAGKSLAELARAVNYSKGYLSKVETGHRAPSPDLARRCDAALGAEGALASLIPVARADGASPHMSAVEDQWIMTVDKSGKGSFAAVPRRDVLALGTMSLLSWATLKKKPPVHETASQLHSFRSVFEEMRLLSQGVAPAVLLPMLIGQTHALKLLVAASPAAASALLLAGRFAEFTGWIAQEAGDDRGALWWTDHALQLATASGDHELSAYTLVRRGLMAMYRFDARETIALAARAQTARCGARVRGLAALREAQGHALIGSYRDCYHALDRAATLLATPSGDPRQPILGTTTTTDPVGMVTGWCLHELGRSRQAAEVLEREVTSLPGHARRTRARIGARYALALVAAGELDRGCVAASQALDALALADSATVRTDLRRLARELRRWRTDRAVNELIPRLIDALNTMSTR